MRTISIGNQKIDVRGLTIGEIRQLKAEGFPISWMGVSQKALDENEGLAASLAERVIDLVLTPEQLEQIAEQVGKEILKVWGAVLAETYSAPDEEKN